jgi:hypothetical protein
VAGTPGAVNRIRAVQALLIAVAFVVAVIVVVLALR